MYALQRESHDYKGLKLAWVPGLYACVVKLNVWVVNIILHACVEFLSYLASAA